MAKKKKRIKRVFQSNSEELAETKEEKKEEWHHVVTMEDLGELSRKLHVVYDTTAVGMALDKSCEIVGKKVQLKGFRKGKAPKPLVEMYYREEIEKSASSLLTQEGFLHACYEQKIQPLGEPKIESAEFHIDGTFTCDIILEVKPTIEATGYIGLQLTKPKINRDEILNKMLEDAKNEHMMEVPTEEVKAGCVVSLDFNVGTVSGEHVSEGKDHHFMINSGQEPPFGENLIGKKAGDSFIENVILPEQIEKYGGESALVNATIKSVFERVLPNDQEFVEAMKAPSYDELMEAFSKHAEQEATKREMQTLEENVITKLLELHSFSIPAGWANDEEKYLISQFGLSGDIDETIKQHIQQMAERNVRRTFILEAVYDAEPSLRVTKEEFEAWLEQEAAKKQVSSLVLKKDLQDQKMLDGVFGLVKHRKVLNFIISQARITTEGDMPKVVEQSYEMPENPLG
jgi:trigger factor